MGNVHSQRGDFLKNLHFSQQHLLNETEHKVLSCILNAIEQGDTKINIRMIARQAYVSTTTVVKLAKKLGYQGYSAMIYSLRHSVDEEQKPAEGIELTSILDPVNEPAIDMFVELLLKHQNNCIFIIGLGFSTIASSYFMRRLATLGFLAYDGSPSDMMRREDTPSLCIFFSKSGETKDLINIAQYARAPQKPWRQPHPLFNVYPAYSMAVIMVRSAGTLYFLPKK